MPNTPETEPTITPGREYSVRGRTFKTEKVEYPGDDPYWDIICPDGIAFETDEPYDHDPTNAEIEEVAGIYFSELKQEGEPLYTREPDFPTGWDMYGVEL